MFTMFFCFALAVALVPIMLLWHWMQWLRRRRALPPYQRGLRRATDGAFLLALCAYAATLFPQFLGRSVGDLVNAFLRTPRDPDVALVVFAAFVTLGLVQLVAGAIGARRGGDRDPVSAIGALLVAGGFFYLLEWNWFLPRTGWEAGLANIALKGLYIAVITASLVRAYLCLPSAGSAVRVVARHIEQRAVVWRAARSS
jgi:hypothetical protein